MATHRDIVEISTIARAEQLLNACHAYRFHKDFHHADECYNERQKCLDNFAKQFAKFKINDIVTFKNYKHKRRFYVVRTDAIICGNKIIIGYVLNPLKGEHFNTTYSYAERTLMTL